MAAAATGYFGLYRARVVNAADPLNAGRLLLQVPTVTGFRQTAWAEPSHPSGFPVIAPKPGDPVWVQFVGGDTGQPVWMGIPSSTGGSGSVVSFDDLLVGNLTVTGTVTLPASVTLTNLTVTSTITVPDSSIPVSKISGLTTALGNYVTLDSAQTITGAKTLTSKLIAPQIEMTPSVGTARGRFGGLSGVEAWTGMFLNAQYVTGSGWLLDDSTKPGWFFKLDSRSIAGGAYQEFAVYRIPSGAGYHTDEAVMLRVGNTGNLNTAGTISENGARVYSPNNPQPVVAPSAAVPMMLMGA